MKPQKLRELFDQLADRQEKRLPGPTHELLQTLFTDLLKTVYSMIRGQASLRFLQQLIQLEIKLGGDDADFKSYDDRRMVDLFERGQVADAMRTFGGEGGLLSTAMDLDAVRRWLTTGPEKKSRAAVRLVDSWLRLFAEEAGLMDSTGREAPVIAAAGQPPPRERIALPRPGEPFADPVTGMALVFVPGGTFPMGDTFGDGAQDEQPVHAVSLSPFFMGTYPVTQAQWNVLMEENPSGFVGDQHPVEQVAYDDVMAFIGQLNAASPSGVVYALPSEAQWEYAARSGGLDERYAGGSEPDALAWFEANNDGHTAPVGTKAPNGLGIYDMSGNVWEWCRDFYRESAYKHHAKVDPVCATGGRDRVIRGGSWHLDAWSLRCSRRFRFDPELVGPALGFRVVMEVKK